MISGHIIFSLLCLSPSVCLHQFLFICLSSSFPNHLFIFIYTSSFIYSSSSVLLICSSALIHLHPFLFIHSPHFILFIHLPYLFIFLHSSSSGLAFFLHLFSSSSSPIPLQSFCISHPSSSNTSPWLTRIRFTRLSLTRIFKKFPFLT